MKTMCQDLNQVGLFLIIFGHLLCWLRDGQKCIDRSLAGDKGWWSSWCDLYEDYYHCHCCYKKWMTMTWPLQRLGSPHLSPVRYVLKIHFFIESGLKMIQFKTKSKIFIQKNIHSKQNPKYSFKKIFIQ